MSCHRGHGCKETGAGTSVPKPIGAEPRQDLFPFLTLLPWTERKSNVDIFILNLVQTAELIKPKLFVTCITESVFYIFIYLWFYKGNPVRTWTSQSRTCSHLTITGTPTTENLSLIDYWLFMLLPHQKHITMVPVQKGKLSFYNVMIEESNLFFTITI